MILRRREFLALLGAGAGAAALEGCGVRWRVPDDRVELALRGPGIESWHPTVCTLCRGGCGLLVRTVDGLPVGLKGNPRHPVSRGGLCPVGLANLEVLYSPARLEGPLRRGEDGELRPTDWETAIAEVAGRLADLLAAGEGDRVAMLDAASSDVFRELARRFLASLGSSSLATLGGPDRFPFLLTQGLDGVPAFDLGGSDLALSFGLDLFAEGPAPVHAMAAAIGSRPTEDRMSLLAVGTRMTPGFTKAERFVAIRPGTHGAFALGVAHVLVREGRHDRRFVADHTHGFADWTDPLGRRRLGFERLLLERYYPQRVARICGCAVEDVVWIARRFAAASRPVAIAGGEAAAGTNAVWTVMAVQALDALVGAFDRRGGVVLPPPVPLTPPEPLPGPAPAPSLFAAKPGSAALSADPVDAVVERGVGGDAPLRVLLVLGGDPVASSPAGEALREAMRSIPLVVSFSPYLDETAAAADLVLPPPTSLETWAEATTPETVSSSVLGLGEPVLDPLLDTRHPGDVLLALAGSVGGPVAAALPWSSYEEHLRHRLEGLWVSGQGSAISGSFEESWIQFLERRGWRFLEHDDPEVFCDDLARQGGWWNPVREHGDWGRLFRTPSGRYEFFSSALERRLIELGRSSAAELDDGAALAAGCAALSLEASGDEACLPHHEPPRQEGHGELLLQVFRPITGRGVDGVASPMVMEMFGYPNLSGWETWLELAPETAAELALEDGDEVAAETPRGEFAAVVRVRPGGTPGVAQVPVGLGREVAGAAGGGVGSNPYRWMARVADPLSGRLSTASTRVSLRLLHRRAHGAPAPLSAEAE